MVYLTEVEEISLKAYAYIMENHSNTNNNDQSSQEINQPQVPINTSVVPSESSNLPEKPKKGIKNLLVVLVIVLLAIGGWLFYHYQTSHKASVVMNSPSNTKTATIASDTISINGYEFYKNPITLGNLNFFKNTNQFGCMSSSSNGANCQPIISSNQISYAKIGLTPQKQPIIDFYDYSAGLGSFSYLAIEYKPNYYEVATKGDTSLDSFKSSLSDNVSLNSSISLPPLNFPNAITINNEAYTVPANYSGAIGYFIPNLTGIRGSYNGSVKSSAVTKVGSSGNYTYYEVTAEDHPNYQVDEIYAVLGNFYAGEYTPINPTGDSHNSSINWSQGSTSVTSAYVSTTLGCGSPYGFVVAKGISPSELTLSGYGPNNTSIYSLPTSNSLLQLYYQNYGGGSYLQDNSLKNLTIAQFQNDHAVVVVKNGLGQYVVYIRNDMFAGGGCGKPVIYLYPTKKTKVSVRVGANVTVSNPIYKANGWQNLTAYPNGNISVGSKTYTSLFWEGTGFGPYPLISQGTVVARAAAIPTIKRQLIEQGLTTKEINAFISYWSQKLPSTPYIRLTWLDTRQMNNLAPLSITPNPNTLIRVFLDFQGLDYPEKLTPQVFNAPKRIGFTVVEWGGLLRNSR